jgi:hypothetical protein
MIWPATKPFAPGYCSTRGFQKMFLMVDIPVTRTVCSDGEAIRI